MIVLRHHDLLRCVVASDAAYAELHATKHDWPSRMPPPLTTLDTLDMLDIGRSHSPGPLIQVHSFKSIDSGVSTVTRDKTHRACGMLRLCDRT